MLNYIKSEKNIRIVFGIDFIYFFIGFLILPIFAIYLKNKLNFSFVQIGILITIPSLVSSLTGSINQIVNKKIGLIKTLILGIFLESLVFVVIILHLSYITILLFSIVHGLGRAIWVPLYKSIYISSLNKKENVGLTFKLRYILICISAILAPVLSTFLYAISYNLIFYISLFLFLAQIFLIYVYKSKLIIYNIEKTTEKASFKILKTTFLKYNFLIYYIIGSILILTVFSQFESTFSLSIAGKIENPELIFSFLLILNSIFGIIFQLLGMIYLKKISAMQNLIIGSIFFLFSSLMFSLRIFNIYFLTITILLFTMGETMIIPNLDILINDFSKKNEKALLYGIAEMRRIGFFLGPLLSSFFIEKWGSKKMYLIFSFIALLAVFIFIILKNIKPKIFSRNRS